MILEQASNMALANTSSIDDSSMPAPMTACHVILADDGVGRGVGSLVGRGVGGKMASYPAAARASLSDTMRLFAWSGLTETP